MSLKRERSPSMMDRDFFITRHKDHYQLNGNRLSEEQESEEKDAPRSMDDEDDEIQVLEIFPVSTKKNSINSDGIEGSTQVISSQKTTETSHSITVGDPPSRNYMDNPNVNGRPSFQKNLLPQPPPNSNYTQTPLTPPEWFVSSQTTRNRNDTEVSGEEMQSQSLALSRNRSANTNIFDAINKSNSLEQDNREGILPPLELPRNTNSTSSFESTDRMSLNPSGDDDVFNDAEVVDYRNTDHFVQRDTSAHKVPEWDENQESLTKRRNQETNQRSSLEEHSNSSADLVDFQTNPRHITSKRRQLSRSRSPNRRQLSRSRSPNRRQLSRSQSPNRRPLSSSRSPSRHLLSCDRVTVRDRQNSGEPTDRVSKSRWDSTENYATRQEGNLNQAKEDELNESHTYRFRGRDVAEERNIEGQKESERESENNTSKAMHGGYSYSKSNRQVSQESGSRYSQSEYMGRGRPRPNKHQFKPYHREYHNNWKKPYDGRNWNHNYYARNSKHVNRNWNNNRNPRRHPDRNVGREFENDYDQFKVKDERSGADIRVNQPSNNDRYDKPVEQLETHEQPPKWKSVLDLIKIFKTCSHEECVRYGKEFPSRDLAKTHMSSAHKLKRCDVCFVLLSTRDTIHRAHFMRLHADEKEQKGACAVCGERFGYEGLYKHMSRRHFIPQEDELAEPKRRTESYNSSSGKMLPMQINKVDPRLQNTQKNLKSVSKQPRLNIGNVRSTQRFPAKNNNRNYSPPKTHTPPNPTQLNSIRPDLPVEIRPAPDSPSAAGKATTSVNRHGQGHTTMNSSGYRAQTCQTQNHVPPGNGGAVNEVENNLVSAPRNRLSNYKIPKRNS